MNSIYFCISFIVFFAVFLNFYKNNKAYVYPAVFIMQFRYFIVLIDFEKYTSSKNYKSFMINDILDIECIEID